MYKECLILRYGVHEAHDLSNSTKKTNLSYYLPIQALTQQRVFYIK